ncbi:MAG TPA: acyl carrier protein [Candidatus Nocardiopsis merdipullorum]|nr:acyl carrier protein [Candidatus Nocardiopsis merdipullorum]
MSDTDHRWSIREFISQEFAPDVPPDDIDDDHDLLGGAVIDSLGVYVVIAWLKENHGVEADEGDYDSFRSVQSIDDLIRERSGKD